MSVKYNEFYKVSLFVIEFKNDEVSFLGLSFGIYLLLCFKLFVIFLELNMIEE